MNSKDPVAYILITGHGTKIVDKKPYCEVDLWQGLYLESFVRQQQIEIEALKLLAENPNRYDGWASCGGYEETIKKQQAEIEALKSVVYWLKENRPEVWDDIQKWRKQ